MFPRDPAPESTLRAPWQSVLATGWIGVGLALVAVASASRRVGKPVWWLGDAVPISPTVWWIVPLIGPLVAVLARDKTARTALIASGGASAIVLAIAVRDLGVSPAAGLVELMLGSVGVLLTIAASAGVPTRPRTRPNR